LRSVNEKPIVKLDIAAGVNNHLWTSHVADNWLQCNHCEGIGAKKEDSCAKYTSDIAYQRRLETSVSSMPNSTDTSDFNKERRGIGEYRYHCV